VPKQLVVKNDASSIPAEVAKAGLKLPLGMPSVIVSVFMVVEESLLFGLK